MKKSKILLTIFLAGVVVLTGCGSTKTEAPQEKTPEQKGIERVSNILDPGKIEVESDEVHKMNMTISDFEFLTQRQFHDFVFNQKNRGKFKTLKVYLSNGAYIMVTNGDKLSYVIPEKSILQWDYINFEYNSESGLYIHEKTKQYLKVNPNPAYPKYE